MSKRIVRCLSFAFVNGRSRTFCPDSFMRHFLRSAIRPVSLLLFALFTVTLLYSNASLAVDGCIATTQPRTVNIKLPARVVPHANVPVGGLITPWFYSAAISDLWLCDNRVTQVKFGIYHGTSLSPAGQKVSDSGTDYTVYKTNRPGVGVIVGYNSYSMGCRWKGAFWDIGNSQPVRQCGTAGPDIQGSQVSVALVKTGNIAAGGMLTPGTVARVLPTENWVVQNIAEVTFVASDVEIIVPPCSVSDITVPMGTVFAKDFKAVGSTGAARDFSLTFGNCPKGLGAIKYQFEATSAIIDAKRGVVDLSPASSAKGIGLQLLNDKGAAVEFNRLYTIGNYDSTTDNSYTVPLKAALYQTQDKVTGGTVNAKILFTLSYE